MGWRWASQIRLRHWAHFLLLPLAGVDPASARSVQLPAVARGVGIAFLVLSFGYLLNAISDREMDATEGKNALPRAGHEPHRIAVVLLAAGALALGVFSPWPVLLATAVCIASGWIYSTGPRLKAVPIVGSLLNVANFAPLLFVGLVAPAVPPSLPLLLGVFVPLLLQNQLLHEAADADEDRGGEVRTTFVHHGRGVSALLAGLCGAGAAAVVLLLGPEPFVVPLVLALAIPFVLGFPFVLQRYGDVAPVMARARVAHRWLSGAAGGALYLCLAIS
jgi:4-hydroxybenzoate polyprenyltransferase